MKTAISLPDELFAEAERFAKDHGLKRSQLIQLALVSYLASRRDAWITEQLNRVYADGAPPPEPIFAAAAAEMFRQVEWEAECAGEKSGGPTSGPPRTRGQPSRGRA